MVAPLGAGQLDVGGGASSAGLFNAVLKFLHLPTSQWMQSTSMAVPAMVLASTWMNMGGAVLIYLAALQNIPGSLYEAAELDGAGLFKRIRHVTIPQTKLILSLMAMLQVVATMQLFIEPLILANGAGTQDSATSVAASIPVRPLPPTSTTPPGPSSSSRSANRLAAFGPFSEWACWSAPGTPVMFVVLPMA